MSFKLAHEHIGGADVKTSTFAGSSKPTKKNKKNNSILYNTSKMNSSNSINHLQKSIGNQAVQRLMDAGAGFESEIAIQPKLKVSRPADAYEQEAERVADDVMKSSSSSPESNVKLSSPMSNNEKQLDRKCKECQLKEGEETGEEKLNASRKPSSSSLDLEASEEIANQINNARVGGGSLLDFSTREFMESRFGHDFSKVKIHTGEMAHRSASKVNALAYTIGDDIVFEEGQYQPHTSEGRRLLAHELTHVVQQSSNTASSTTAAGFITSKISSTEGISRQKGPTVASVETLEEQFEHAILKSDWLYAVDRLAAFNTTEIPKMLERYVISQSALNHLKEAALNKFGSDESRIIPAINTLIGTKFRAPTAVVG